MELPSTLSPVEQPRAPRAPGRAATTVNRGSAWPIGATIVPGGVNFCVFSRTAAAIDLLLFNREDDVKPARVILLDPQDRTYHYWHIFVPDLKPGQLYAYRANGPFDPAAGLRFDPSKILLDPYG